jgi:hypothetical protein
MVAAGAELAITVGGIASGPVCGLPREWVLRDKQQSSEDGDEQPPELPPDYG